MSDEIFCMRLQKNGPAITTNIPFRAELKEQVLANVCQETWNEWLVEQVKIINELALNLGDPRSHDIIEQRAKEYFGFEGEGYESIEATEGGEG
jgi:Fe-S cluster biosynthesis and repair protein YggX